MVKICISAGEPSGDLHGAALIQKLLAKRSDIQFFGMGGTHMSAAGCKLVVDCQKLSVVGIWEILLHFKDIYRAMKIMQGELRKQKPDLLVLIDYSGFNLRLAKYAKKQGIKVVYFISPHVWIWRQGRIKTIKKYIDHMAVIYPFEVDFYLQNNIPVTYVGNAIVDRAKPSLTREETYQRLDLNTNKKIIALVPGSRKTEILRNFATILQTAEMLDQQHPDLEFVLPLATSLSLADLQPYLDKTPLKIKIFKDELHNIMQCSHAAIAVSGTVTLELALFAVPMVIIYKTEPISFAIAMKFIKTEHIGMCNLIAKERVVKEFLQKQATAENIAKEINQILIDANYRETIRKKLLSVKNALENNPAQRDIAEVVLDNL